MTSSLLGFYTFALVDVLGVVAGTCLAVDARRPRTTRVAAAFCSVGPYWGLPLALSVLVAESTLVRPGVGLGLAALGIPLGLVALAESARRLPLGQATVAVESARGVCLSAWLAMSSAVATVVVYT